MENEKIETMLNEVGRLLAMDTTYPIDGTFLYAEVASQMVNPSIFKDLGDHLLFRVATSELCDALLELWEAENPEKRWAAIQYRIDGEKFHVSFTYPEEIDPNEPSRDRRSRILQQRYGNKPIDYPSLR